MNNSQLKIFRGRGRGRRGRLRYGDPGRVGMELVVGDLVQRVDVRVPQVADLQGSGGDGRLGQITRGSEELFLAC